MSSPTAFQLVQVLYWLALSTWFGGVLFIAIAAPVIFRTVRDADPLLPHVLSVNLEGQHGTLLAGTIVSDLLARLGRIQLACAGALAVVMLLQLLVIDTSHTADPLRSNRTAVALRWALLLAAVAVVVYDLRVVWPRVTRFRREYLDHADEPEVANPAKDHFDREQRRSVTLLMAVVAILLAMIAFSGNITPAGRETIVVRSSE